MCIRDRVNDGRRGEGIFDKVLAAMDLMKKHGLLFGTSICYTRANLETCLLYTSKTEMNTVKVRKTEELEAEQLGAHSGEIVRLHGSIYKIRKMSSFAFVLLRTKRQMVQCVYEPA